MDSSVTLIRVDTNSAEDAVFQALLAIGGSNEVTRQRLDVGDILVCRGDTRICLERKRWSDLSASICDGRYHEQKMRMLPSETQRYAYVVEGELATWDGHCRGMAQRCMWAALVKTVLRDSIPVFHTQRPADTASLCMYIASQLEHEAFEEAGGARHAIAGVKPRKRDNLKEPQAVMRAMLCVIPGMSMKKAAAVVAHWGTFAALAGADPTQLADVCVGTRRLGPKLAFAISQIL